MLLTSSRMKGCPEIPTSELDIRGAVYDIRSGNVEWL